MATITIRDANLEDASAIVGLISEHATIAGERSPITEAYVAIYLSNPASRILLAEIQNRVVGLLSYSLRPNLYHAGPSCLIEELIVEEATRGHGVGSALVAELFSRLPALACAEVSVTVMFTNQQAIRFYRRHGLAEEVLSLEMHFNRGDG